MLVPSPLPDEILNGYVGRVRMLNGFRTDQETYSMLRGHANQKTDRPGLTGLNSVSSITSLPLHRLIADHTLIPFLYAYGGTEGRIGNCAGRSFSSLRIRAVAKKGVYLCEKCVLEDVQFHGYSYWRRTHQLPGVNWCVKHGTPLHKNSSKDVYCALPECQIESAHSYPLDYIRSIQSNTVIQRYVELCCAYLSHHAPKSPLEFSRKLRWKTGSSRTHYSERLQSLKLSEMALEALPVEWLQTNFPKIAALKSNEWLWSLDGIVSTARNNFATANFALAAALGGLDDIAIFRNPRDLAVKPKVRKNQRRAIV